MRRTVPSWRLPTAVLLVSWLAMPLASAQDQAAGAAPTLRILAHDYFSPTDAVVDAFEHDHGVTVEIVPGGDANEVVEQAIRQAGRPTADLLFGVDNLVYRRAVEAGVFEEYAAERRGEIPRDIRAQFEDSRFVTPIDFGYVTLN